jgi:hypothetical protein
MLNSVEVIAALGGYQSVSKALELHWRTVYNWTQPGRRIPADNWRCLAAIPSAKEAGVTMALLASLPFNRK